MPEGAHRGVLRARRRPGRSTRRPAGAQLRTIDATCPLVTKVHGEARRFAADDYDILLIGHEGHEEVVGTDRGGARARAPGRRSGRRRQRRRSATRRRSPGCRRPRCRSTRRSRRCDGCASGSRAARPAERRHLLCHAEPSGRREGDRRASPSSSSSSARPTRPTRCAWSRSPSSAARATAELVDKAAELEEAWLDGVTTVGVTSGASVPEILVRGVLDWLAERGYADVQEVVAAEESLLFALPQELRRDMKAKAATGR